MKFIKKNMLFIVAFVLLLSSVIFFVYTIKADSDDNKIGISYAEITGIQTGTEGFTNDGLDYSDTASYHVTTGYVAGTDASDNNAIVRSFDKITYNFELGIKNKEELGNTNSLTAYSDKTVLVTATISEEAAKYVAFEENGKPGSTSYTYEIKNVSEVNGSKVNGSISMYVLGAPNGTIIDPKFEIEESTNNDNDYIVTLGNEGTKHNYKYDYLEENKYSTYANFYNYMPTVVSSVDSSDIFVALVSGDSQKATYESKVGRYMNFVLGIYTNGDLKGKRFSNEQLTFDGSFSQTGSESLIIKPEFVRLYNESKVEDINPVAVNMPYSSTTVVNSSNYTRVPGTIEASDINNNSFNIKINDYDLSYSYPTSNADGSSVNGNYIGTYAITLFSPRSTTDGNSDISVNLNVNGISASAINQAYSYQDYNLIGHLYDIDGKTQVDSKSKGSEILYVTEFNYASSSSKEGLKEIIKIDPNAFRFMSQNDKDIDITLYCGDKECTNITKDDFEIKFVGGDFDNANYTATNYDEVDSRIKDEEASIISTGCAAVSANLANLNRDQIMNLYGGPCIKETNPKTYNSISEAVTGDNEEIVLSKAIVQTKKDVKLPDNVKVVMKVKLRVRNVNDITQRYQVTTVATSSDYDSKITYYAPMVVNNAKPRYIVTNPDNYIKEYGYIETYGDDIQISRMDVSHSITVLNKNKDGKMKTNFNAVDNETIHLKVSSNLNDLSMNVGADDVWYINSWSLTVDIAGDIEYVPNEYSINPTGVREYNSIINGVPQKHTQLTYSIPCSKPNQTIPNIYFDIILSPTMVGNGNNIHIISTSTALNINNEPSDPASSSVAYIDLYGNGINNMVLSLINNVPTTIEKNSEYAYTINAFNNTNDVITDYTILNVLPYTGDDRGSTYTGKQSVHLDISNIGNAKVYCTTDNPQTINEDVNDTEAVFNECSDILNAGVYKEITAFKITNIGVPAQSNMVPIKVSVKTDGNKFSDTYVAKVIGGSATFMPIKSNDIKYEVISRKITGKVFIDVDEDGVQKGTEINLENIPVSLYKINDNGDIDLVKETTTLKSGVYTFDNLDKGFYKIRFVYDSNNYDVALRYAIEDTDRDSDGYKISEGIAEITNKHDPYSHNGIDLVTNTEVKNMDLGLINRKPFGMTIKKYITKVDLNYNGITDTKTYNNESKVLLSVKNSLKATAKVYYGFEITNNSQVAGYVENIYEDIPEGLNFSSDDSYNAGWILVDGKLQNTSFQNRLIRPGESIFAQIALTMPSREEAGSFLNRVTLDIKSEDPKPLASDAAFTNDNVYAVGESVEYAGSNWHVINAVPSGDNQLVTLLLDDESANSNGSIVNGVYKWSNAHPFFVGNFTRNKMLFEDNIICDDASGLINGSHGGTLKDHEPCTSGQYVTSKIRLLTEEEYNGILAMNLSDVSWLYGTRDFYLQNAVNIPADYDAYGNPSVDYSKYIKYVDASNAVVGIVSIDEPSKLYRAVITVNSKYILE